MGLDLRPAEGEEGTALAERRLLVLQQLTAALARARSYEAVASVIIHEGE